MAALHVGHSSHSPHTRAWPAVSGLRETVDPNVCCDAENLIVPCGVRSLAGGAGAIAAVALHVWVGRRRGRGTCLRRRRRASSVQRWAWRTARSALGLPDAGKFRLSSVCGQPTDAYAFAKVEEEGRQPAGLQLAAVASTGYKRRYNNMNQDCLGIECDSGDSGLWVGVVADGHGSDGHHWAARVCALLPASVSQVIHDAGGMPQSQDVAAALRDAFTQTERELEKAAKLEEFNSETAGCAALAVAVDRGAGVAHVAWCGDCQAVLLDMSERNFCVNQPHKAHDPAERSRIEEAGGAVSVEHWSESELHSRVYAPDGTFGLAMSRCFGDLDVKRHGVVAEPAVETWPLPEAGCLVLASDGLFEFISPAEVAERLREELPVRGAALCSEALVAEAQRRWIDEEGDYCDDVSCLLLEFSALDGASSDSSVSIAGDVALLD